MVKIAFIGAGGIAAHHMKSLTVNPKVEIVGICDVVREHAQKMADLNGGQAYTDYEAMLDREKPDGLIVCVPPFAHGQVEEAAASRGIHMLVEKPVGLDMDTVRKKAEVLREAGVIVGTGYCLRYLEAMNKAKEYLQDKQIAMVRALRSGGMPEMPWWGIMDKSGGQLVEMTTHNVDMMRCLAGDITKVSADMNLLVMKDTPGVDVPDVTSASFVFASGAVGHIDTTFFPQPVGRSILEVMGPNYLLTIEGKTLTIIEGKQTIVYKGDDDYSKAQDDAFIEAIDTGNRSLIKADYSEGVKTLEVTLAANSSAASGQSVYLA
ncbi:gfo/Idh/MocA family oxidoreductase [Paenibacillus sp. LMG 31456]|uniref:Gfo/Idh/MocA family oxidoreductase n=1 Tax=Paenibacillus foliorum TaxID=2654974 RepID=A0A972GKX6_9BACL|nr:Gfo/Idh/MocA family oxidoreductase [Paenibacillus foliorum]NOU92681.1 gfo/Idh/MocA family oxidoreductase [Paenibacillus foliorum]